MKNISSRLCLGAAIACFTCVLDVVPSLAFQLLPLTQYFSPAGIGSTQSYQVNNNQSKTVAVEVAVMKREIDSSGQEKLFSADEDFIVYPSQIILAPGASQSLRVTWLGEENPPSELAYRLVAEQLPVSFEKNKKQPNPGKTAASVDVLMRYLGSIFIRPAESEPNLVITSVGDFKDSASKQYLELWLSNTGSELARLAEVEIQVSSQEKQVVLAQDSFNFQGQKIILAGGKRRLLIPWPTDLPHGNVTAKLLVK